jgi:hypothetical protein
MLVICLLNDVLRLQSIALHWIKVYSLEVISTDSKAVGLMTERYSVVAILRAVIFTVESLR